MRKVGRRLGKVLITEALVVNRRTKSFESVYNTCCALTNIKTFPTSLVIPVQDSGQINMTAFDLCTYQTVNVTASADFFSSNAGVADVGEGNGVVWGAGVGTATVNTALEYFRYESIVDPCALASFFKDTDTEVRSVSQSPPLINMSTGDTKQITVTIEPSNVSVTTSFVTNLTSNPDSSCVATLSIPGQTGNGSINHDVTASPAGCSGVFSTQASASGVQSNNISTVAVPPQMLIQMIVGEAGAQDQSPTDTSQKAVAVTMRNRLGDSAFPGCSSNYQGCLSTGDVVLAAINNGPQPELDNAMVVYTRAVGDIVFGSQCFWTPTAAQWGIVQQAIQSGTTQFPQGTGSPSCFAQENRQIVHVTSVGMHVDGRGAIA